MKRFTMRQRAGGAMFAALLACGATLVVLPGSGAGAAPISVATVCNDSGPFTRKDNGSFHLISDPMIAALQTTPVPLLFSGDATATPTINPGGTITYHVTLDVHPHAIAQDALTNSVQPALLAAPAPAPNYVNYSAVNLRIDQLTANLPVPGLTNLVGGITASTTAGGPSITATADGTGVNFTLGAITANASAGVNAPATSTIPDTPDFTITLDFTAQATTAVAGDVITLHPGDISFLFAGPDATHGGFNVGLKILGASQYGGADGPMACDTTDSILASTNVVASTNTTTTTTSTTTTTQPTTTSTTKPSTTTTTTTAPTTTTTTTAPTTTTTTTAPTTTTTAPTTSTTKPSTTTTTDPGTTTTTDPGTTTTTDPGTTTTTDPGTTSTLPPGIPGDTGSTVPATTVTTIPEVTVTEPEVTDPATTAPEVTDPGTTATTTDGGVLGTNGGQGTGGTGLARTGAELMPLGAFGAILLLLGAAFVRRSRRQES